MRPFYFILRSSRLQLSSYISLLYLYIIISFLSLIYLLSFYILSLYLAFSLFQACIHLSVHTVKSSSVQIIKFFALISVFFCHFPLNAVMYFPPTHAQLQNKLLSSGARPMSLCMTIDGSRYSRNDIALSIYSSKVTCFISPSYTFPPNGIF